MATRQSLEIARTIHEQAPGITPEVKIVAFGVEELEGDVLTCAEAGLSGYVPFDAQSTSLRSGGIGRPRRAAVHAEDCRGAVPEDARPAGSSRRLA
jgi:hypothetical protein